MPIPDEELARRCREVFGEPLERGTRAAIAAALEALAADARRVRESLDPASEPAGHAALLRETRRGG